MLAGVAVCVWVGASAAAPPAGHHLDVAALTDFPLLVGGGVAYELPVRLRAEVTAGVLPGPYVDAINWGMTTFDVYSETTAELIDVVLQNSFVLHSQIGYRPLPRRGLSVSLGHQYINLGGDTADISLFGDIAVPERLLEIAEAEAGELETKVSAHMISGEIGYQWQIQERLSLRATAAFAYTLHASAAVSATQEARNPVSQEALDLVTVAAEDYLEFVFEEWVHLPMVGVSAGYRFY